MVPHFQLREHSTQDALHPSSRSSASLSETLALRHPGYRQSQRLDLSASMFSYSLNLFVVSDCTLQSRCRVEIPFMGVITSKLYDFSFPAHFPLPLAIGFRHRWQANIAELSPICHGYGTKLSPVPKSYLIDFQQGP